MADTEKQTLEKVQNEAVEVLAAEEKSKVTEKESIPPAEAISVDAKETPKKDSGKVYINPKIHPYPYEVSNRMRSRRKSRSPAKKRQKSPIQRSAHENRHRRSPPRWSPPLRSAATRGRSLRRRRSRAATAAAHHGKSYTTYSSSRPRALRSMRGAWG